MKKVIKQMSAQESPTKRMLNAISVVNKGTKLMFALGNYKAMPMWNAIYAMNKDTKLMYAQRNLKL
jgi:hypothetical protein